MGQMDKNKKKQKKQIQQKKTVQIPANYPVSKWVWVALGLVVLTTFTVYFRAIGYELLTHWDDKSYVTDNTRIMDFHWANLKLIFSEFYAGNYHPITTFMYAIEYKLVGTSGTLYHLNNIILHLLNTFLVFVLIRKISPKNAWGALITAAFFAVHPMHVESVAWVSERKDVLYAFFFLLSLIMYSDYLCSQKSKYIILSAIFFILSCLSKPAAVVLPLVLFIMDYYSNRKYKLKLIIEKLPFLLIALIFGIIAVKAQGDAIHDTSSVPFIQHFALVTYSFMSYIIKAIVPVNLSAIYPYPVEYGSQLPGIYYLSILLVGLLLFFVWYSRKWGKDIIFGFLFFVITIILVLQFFRVGGVTMSDRYTYIPYIGIFFIFGKLFENYTNKVKGKYKKYSNYLLTIFFLGFILLSALSYNRVKIWENDEKLFSDVIKKYPDCGTPYYLLGDHFLGQVAVVADSANKETNLKRSVKEYQNALKCPLNKEDKVKIHFNKGNAEFYLNDFQAAFEDFDKAVKLDPQYYLAIGNRGTARYQLRDYQGALEDYNRAIELNPQYTDAINNRENVKVMLGISK